MSKTVFSVTALISLLTVTEEKSHIKIPYTTFKEYNKHYRAKYDHSKKKIEEYNVRLLEKIESFYQTIDEEFIRIEQYNFPDMSSLHTNVIQQI